MFPNVKYDAVIVGGGFAGLSAALYLARAFHRVLVCNDGPPRNAPSRAAHALLTHDGAPPAEILRRGRRELDRYGVAWRPAAVTGVTGHDLQFTVTLADGQSVTTTKVLLATGVRDVLPTIPGFAELWGDRVHHCLYCDGWEHRQQPTALYNPTPSAYRSALMHRRATEDLILLTDGDAPLTDAQREHLRELHVEVTERPLTHLTPTERGVRLTLADGTAFERHALFHTPPFEQRSDLARQLGCTVSANAVEVDATGMTSVPGVYAAGDMTHGTRHHLSAAIESGARAAVHLAHALFLQTAQPRA